MYRYIVNFNMFQGPSHSKASGLDTYNIYGCLQHLAEASHRDWWVGSACGTPFVPLSRGRLLSLAVDSIFGDWDISFRDPQGKENAAVHPKIAFLVVATFLNPIQIGSGATTSSRVPINFLQVWRDH